jgi:hypothetical protein
MYDTQSGITIGDALMIHIFFNHWSSMMWHKVY